MAELQKSSWDGLEEDEDLRCSQEELSRDTMRAEACRSSSDDEDSVDRVEEPFWVTALKNATTALGHPPPPQSDPVKYVKVISGCTGMGSEGFVLKAGPAWVDEGQRGAKL